MQTNDSIILQVYFFQQRILNLELINCLVFRRVSGFNRALTDKTKHQKPTNPKAVTMPCAKNLKDVLGENRTFVENSNRNDNEENHEQLNPKGNESSALDMSNQPIPDYGLPPQNNGEDENVNPSVIFIPQGEIPRVNQRNQEGRFTNSNFPEINY